MKNPCAISTLESELKHANPIEVAIQLKKVENILNIVWKTMVSNW